MTDPQPHFVFAEPFDDAAVEFARSHGRVSVLDRCDRASLTQAIGDCDALLIRSAARVTRGVVEHAGRLRVIGRAGTGLDHIDMAAVRERGIAVLHTPGAATEAVADLTIALMIGALRGITVGDGMVRDGRFDEARRLLIGREMRELTLGVVGMGRIGRAVGKRCCLGFGMRVLFNDVQEVHDLGFDAEPVEKADLYGESDIVSLHVPLTKETRGLIGGRALAGFRGGSVLVNTSRGAVVDSAAVVDALRSGRLAAAALDVFDEEPLPADHPLLSAPNTLVTPHLGARTHRSLQRARRVVGDVVRLIEGGRPQYSVLG